MADDPFYVTTEVGGRTIQFRHRIPDPLVSQRVTIGWLDLLRGLWRRKLVVTVTVGGDADVVEGVMQVAALANDPRGVEVWAGRAVVTDPAAAGQYVVTEVAPPSFPPMAAPPPGRGC